MISVIIPAYNEEKYIGKCLESIVKHRTKDVCDVIVVDNGSTDGTMEVVKTFPGVRLMHESKKGPNAARQAALNEARGDICVFFDADVILSPGWFEKVQKEFAERPDVVCISGQYYLYDLSWPARTLMWCMWGSSAFFFHSLQGRLITGGNFAVSKKALVAAGGFNTAVAYLADEEDLAHRLSPHGKSVYSNRFFVYASGRRYAKDGFVKTNWDYAINSVWASLFKKPFSSEFRDTR
jgi:glycosyltransferase involved in cell wall biosynthesis